MANATVLMTPNLHVQFWYWSNINIQVTHICVNILASIGSDIGLSNEVYQDIVWTNAVVLLIGPVRTNFS